MIFLTLLLSHSVFFLFFPLSLCPPSLLLLTALLFILLVTYYPPLLFIHPHTLFCHSTSFPSYVVGTSINWLSVFSSPLFSASPFCVLSLSCLLRSCVGFHSVLSSFQPSFVKESKSVSEISIALLLFQEGCGIQVCPFGSPFCAWLPIFHSFSLFLLWMVRPGSWVTYNCLSQPLCCMKRLCFQTRVEWLTIVLETMLSVFLLFCTSTHLTAHLWMCVHILFVLYLTQLF